MSFKYTVEFTNPAIMDLERIKYYLDGIDPSIFIYFRSELILKIDMIEHQPKLFGVLPVKTSVEYRRFFVKQYVVIYDVDEENKLITIDRIYHSKENYYNKFI